MRNKFRIPSVNTQISNAIIDTLLSRRSQNIRWGILMNEIYKRTGHNLLVLEVKKFTKEIKVHGFGLIFNKDVVMLTDDNVLRSNRYLELQGIIIEVRKEIKLLNNPVDLSEAI